MSTSSYTLLQLFEKVAIKHANSPCILAPDKKPLTFSKLVALIEKQHNFFNQQGLISSSRIAIILPNTANAATVFLSVACSMVAVPLNPASTQQELVDTLKRLNVKAIISCQTFLKKIEHIARKTGLPYFLLEVSSDDEAGWFTLQSMRKSTHPVKNIQFYDYANPEDIACIVLTSGSTSEPKLVPVMHKKLCECYLLIAKMRKLTENDRYMNFAYLYHLHGISGLCIPLIAGGSCVLSSESQSVFDLKFFPLFQPTFYTAVPAQHRQLVADAEASNFSYKGSLRSIITGSAETPLPLIQSLERIFNAPVANAYGMSETLGICSNPSTSRESKCNSVGPVLASVELSIVKSDQSLADTNEQGEIIVNSPWVMSGYLNDNASNAESYCELGFKTGDIGYLDEDGYLFLTGRVKELINQGGEKISPFELEKAIQLHPDIDDAIVFPVPDKYLGESVAAAFVTKDHLLAPHELRAFLSLKLPSYKIPRQLKLVSDIPRTSTGKVQRHKLAEFFFTTADRKKSIKAEDKSVSNAEIKLVLKQQWQVLLNTQEQIPEEISFFELGGDSLLYLQLLSSIESSLNINLPWLEGHTIKAQLHYIQSVLARGATNNNPSDLSNEDYQRLFQHANAKDEQQHPDHPLLFAHNTHYSGIPLYFINGNKYLAAHLERRPLYSLLSGYEIIPLHSKNFHALAGHYVDEIQRHNPIGPYLLGGYCSGALLAHEIAKRLLDNGKSVPLLLIVDQYLPYSYSGNISFLPFIGNCFIEDLSKQKNSELLRGYFKHWTVDIIQSDHSAELHYTQSMIIAERMEARILQALNYPQLPALPSPVKKCEIRAKLHRQLDDQLEFSLIITNCSHMAWQSNQVYIVHHWLSESGLAILYNQNRLDIPTTLHSNESYSTSYKFNKINEAGKFILRFVLIDKASGVFSNAYEMGVVIPLKQLQEPILELGQINQLQSQGKLTQAIQYYFHYIQTKQNFYCDANIQLAKALKLARGNVDSIVANKNAWACCTNSEQAFLIHQNLSLNFFAVKDYKNTIIHASKALEIKQDSGAALICLAFVYCEQDNTVELYKTLKKITQTKEQAYPKEVIYGIRDFISKNGRKIDRSLLLDLMNSLSSVNTYHLNSQLLHASILIDEGDFQQAKVLLYKALDVYPYLTHIYEVILSIVTRESNTLEINQLKEKITELRPFVIEKQNTNTQSLTEN